MFTLRGEARATPPLPDQNPPLTAGGLHDEIMQARAAATPPPPPLGIQIAASAFADAGAGSPGETAAHQNHSVIGEDLSIEGQSITIRCRGALEINGKIQAELHSQRLLVGKSGKVEGTITADNVDVHGRVSGTIMGARVVLHPTAEVEGDIHAKSLSVADGASFEGRSRKVTDPATIAPRLEPGAPTESQPAVVPMPRPVAPLPNAPTTTAH
jgi:cytoskeletal protein CcmA (bactofilin family)